MIPQAVWPRLRFLNWWPRDLPSEGLLLRACGTLLLRCLSWGILRSGASFCVTGADSGHFSSAWQAWHFLHVAKTWAGVGRCERWFRIHSSWQAQYWVNLGDILKGWNVSFCEMVVIWFGTLRGKRRTSDASGSFSLASAMHQRPHRKSARNQGKTSFFSFSMFSFPGALAQSSGRFRPVRSLLL